MFTVRRCALTLLFVTSFACTWAPAHADVIADTFGPGDTYQQAGFVLKARSMSPADLDWAFQFTVSGGPYELQQYEMAFGLLSGENDVEVLLMSDDGGNIPGSSILESFVIFDQVVPLPGSIVSVPSPTNPMLADGTYWLAVSALSNGPETLMRWFVGFSALGAYARRDDFGPWTFQGFPSTGAAYRLSADPLTVSVEESSWARVKGLFK